MRRSKTRIDIKREITVPMDDKRAKVRTTTTNKSNISRNVKSAPVMRRSKSQLIMTTKRKEMNINTSNLTPSTISVYIYMYLLLYVCLVLLFI